MSQLDSILSRMIADAMQKENQVFSRALKGGMKIELKVDGVILHMRLSRQNQYPSEVEWRVILDHMPWAVVHKPPARGVNYSLVGLFPIHPRLL